MEEKRIKDLLQRIEKHPTNILDRFVLSKIYYDNQMWVETIEACEAILKLKPDYLVVQIQLGDALMHIGKKKDAQIVLENAREVARTQHHQGMIPEIDEMLESVE